MGWLELIQKAKWLLDLGALLMEVAHDLAIEDGIDPAEFDRKVKDAEIDRAGSIDEALQRLRARLAKA